MAMVFLRSATPWNYIQLLGHTLIIVLRQGPVSNIFMNRQLLEVQITRNSLWVTASDNIVVTNLQSPALAT